MKKKLKEMKYDSKKPTAKLLEDLFPALLSERLEDSESPHLINYFNSNKEFLYYFEAPFSITPEKMKCPYYDFSLLVGELEYLKTIKSDEIYQSKIDLYESKQKIKYVLKSYWYYFDPEIKDTNYHRLAINFITDKYNEFAIGKSYSVCPHSTKPIDCILTYIPKHKILVSELLQMYGGEPITSSNIVLDTGMLYNVLLQNINALKYLENLKIAHNDIKGDNILVDNVLNKKIIRYIDFDIGKILSNTAKTTKVIGLKGFTACYVAPEIINHQSNPLEFRRLIYSPWKCQMYSMGMMMLLLIGFFKSSIINFKEIDSFKSSLTEYDKFMKILEDYILAVQNDQLLKNILYVIKICLSYNSDDRLSANELIEILENLNLKDRDSIFNQYNTILAKRLLKKGNFQLSGCLVSNSHKNLILNLNNLSICPFSEGKKSSKNISRQDAISSDNLYVDFGVNNSYDNPNIILQAEKENLTKIISNLKQEIKTNSQLLIETNSKYHKIIGESSTQITELKQKNDILIKEIMEYKIKFEESIQHKLMNDQLKEQLKELTNVNESYKFQVQEYKNVVKENEYQIKTLLSENKKLKEYEMLFIENLYSFEKIKDVIMKEKYVTFSNCKSFSELATNLYNDFKNLQNSSQIPIANYIEGMHFEKNSYYTGPVNNKNIPQGTGMLINKETNSKFIGEFENGKIKYNLGMWISNNSNYFFGQIINGINETKILNFPKFNIFCGQSYYLGDIKDLNREGFGKYVDENGNYYEGQYKKDEMEGKGKYVWNDGKYYEGEFKNDKREGKGKLVWGPGPNVGDIFEGEYKNDQMEGRGKYVWADGHYHEGEYKKGVKEGKGKFCYFKNGQISEIQEGNFINGKMEGYFKITHPNQEPFYLEYLKGDRITY